MEENTVTNSLSFNEYAEKIKNTAIYPTDIVLRGEEKDDGISPIHKTEPYDICVGMPFVYPLLGLVGETGEIFEKVKKRMRDCSLIDFYDEEFCESIKKEVGDVLWYLNQVCLQFHFTLEEAAQLNIDKLLDRLERDVIKGSGDER